jgi:nucleotide-binding universal stress UspA family protein
MTTLPIAGFFNDVITNQQAKDAQDDMLAVLRETPGGQAVSTLTIATGSVTPDRSYHAIDTQSGAGSDDLDNILQTNHPEGRILIIKPANDARDIVVKHAATGAGEILLGDSADYLMQHTSQHLVLVRVGTVWIEISRFYGSEKALARAFLGVQAQDVILDDLSALSVVGNNQVIVGTGTGVYAHESGNTLRTSLGLAIGTDVQADLDVPSQAEAEAGTATAERVWTAQRVSQAIAALSSGGRELLASYSPSGVASVDITSVLIPEYKHFIIDILSLVPAGDVRIPWLRTSTNNLTYDAGASDYKVNIDAQSGATPTDDSLHSATEAEIALSGAAQLGTAGGESSSYIIDIFDPLNATKDTLLHWRGSYVTSGDQLGHVTGAALRSSAADVDAVQIKFSSGNIESGEIRVYGVKEV